MSDWDWDWLLDGSGLQPQDFNPAPAQKPPTSPPGEYSGATQVPLSVYAPPIQLPDPNAGTPPDNATPTAAGAANALDVAGYFLEGAKAFAKSIVRWGGGDVKAPSVTALDSVTKYVGAPIAIGSGVAGTISDIHQGTSPLEAIVGKIIR